jgi:D-alanyl-D-alanine carboxypeptidase/D-alanyl-D-alanine-endopeptidase (penicillin-binding protein 4)
MIKYDFLYVLAIAAFFMSCKTSAKVSGTPAETVKMNTLVALEDSLMGAHLGVMVVEAETGKVIAEHNSHKYFVPASNTKLLSMYAGLKYLPDTLVGLRYYDAGDTIYAQPAGDPTLLVSEYITHPVMDWLRAVKKPVVIDASNWKAERYGRGWTWSDYQASYQPERSALPVYGNMMPVAYRSSTDHPENAPDSSVFFQQLTMGPYGDGGYKLQPERWNVKPSSDNRFRINRSYSSNSFEVEFLKKDTIVRTELPYVTYGIQTGLRILRRVPFWDKDSLFIFEAKGSLRLQQLQTTNFKLQTIKSQPLDSMLRPMMHRSDNFYAEQTLLMASNEFLGYMSDRDIIDTMMKTDFKGMPDKPVWADGSGLSRYNMLSPADFVWLLDKIKKEFGMDRVKGIMQTGNTGTLTNYYKDLTGKMYAKTGTLSGQVALSGYLYAKSGKLLLFSALVNNHNTEAARVRRQIEKYLIGIWEGN